MSPPVAIIDPTMKYSRARTPEAEFATEAAHDRGIEARAVVVQVFGPGQTLIAQGTSIKVPT